MITAEEFDKALKNFAKTISSQQLRLIYYRPDKDSMPTDCIENVKRFVESNGGSVKYGWTFNHRVSPQYGDYLFATHHAVWLDTNGILIDITPFHAEEKHQPMTIEGSIMFLLDDNAQPIKRGRYLIPRPLKYYPILKNKELKEYLEIQRAEEAKYYKDKFGIVLKYKK